MALERCWLLWMIAVCGIGIKGLRNRFQRTLHP